MKWQNIHRHILRVHTFTTDTFKNNPEASVNGIYNQITKFKCNKCLSEFDKTVKFDKHKCAEVIMRKYATFNNVRKLDNIVKKASTKVQQSVLDGTKYKCCHCDHKVSKISDLYEHRQANHNEINQLSCVSCKRVFDFLSLCSLKLELEKKMVNVGQ